MRLPPLICLIALLWPALAQANAGTPLMWLSMLHLYLGNVFIALFELWLLQRFVRRDKLHDKRNFGLLLLANFLSAWVGYGVLQLLEPVRWVETDLHNALYFAWLALPLAWLFTVLLEWPFVWLALRDLRRSWKQALRASFLIQTVSYLPLAWLYISASSVSLLTVPQQVDMARMNLPQGLVVYALSSDGKRLLEWQDGKLLKESPLPPNQCIPQRRIMIGDEGLGLGMEGLGELRYDNGRREPCQLLIRRGLAGRVATAEMPQGFMGFGPALRFPEVASSPYVFRAGFWAAEGLVVEDRGQWQRLSLELPYMTQFYVRHVQHLPGDIALFQVGQDHLVLYDARSKQLALLGRGRYPLAVLPSLASR